MRYKTPIEVRQSQNIRVRTKLAEIPVDMRKPIPVTEWLKNPKEFSRKKFAEETRYFIDRVYGFEPCLHELPVRFLADEMQNYIDATIGFIESGSEIIVNGKQNPWLKVRDMSTVSIIRWSRELGLTPASRLPLTSIEKPIRDIYDILPFSKV